MSHLGMSHVTHISESCHTYGVAAISRLLKIIGLFRKRTLWKRLHSAKETYDFKEPTNRSHPISVSHVTHMNGSYYTYEWVMSRTWMHHVPLINMSCLAYECETPMNEGHTRMRSTRKLDTQMNHSLVCSCTYVEYACELHAHGINWKHVCTLNMYENYMRMA